MCLIWLAYIGYLQTIQAPSIRRTYWHRFPFHAILNINHKMHCGPSDQLRPPPERNPSSQSNESIGCRWSRGDGDMRLTQRARQNPMRLRRNQAVLLPCNQNHPARRAASHRAGAPKRTFP